MKLFPRLTWQSQCSRVGQENEEGDTAIVFSNREVFVDLQASIRCITGERESRFQGEKEELGIKIKIETVYIRYTSENCKVQKVRW